MHTDRITVGFVTTLVMACCLVLGSFASPVSAKTIIVTTNQDVVDPPFTTTGLCGTGTIADLSRVGQVSLREAVIAANNTPGEKTIKFALNPPNTTIVLTRSLALCGGHTTLNGDVDGNDTPDITLDGTAVLFPFDVLDIFSSHNTVKNLQVLAPGGSSGVSSIGIAPAPEVSTTVVDNTITHNTVTDGTISVYTGFDFSHNGQSFNGATVKHVIVRDNTVLSAPGAGIYVFMQGDHHKVTDVTIAGNTVSGTTGMPSAGILALGGSLNPLDPTDDGASDNHLDVTIKDNIITGNTGNGITVGAGLDNSSRNRAEVTIRGNTLENNAGLGIFTFGAIGAASSPSGESSGNRLDARIEGNTVENASLFGLWVSGGIGGFDGALDKVADNNEVNAVVTDNTITGTTGEGIHLEAGGSGEANGNEVEVQVRKNTVCGSTEADIHAIGGLLGSPFGLLDNTGTGNVLEGEISKNTATTVVVANGTPGNTATVTQLNNVPCP